MEEKDIEICRNITKTIFKNVETLLKDYVGNPKSGEFVKIGADGTPTSYIDIIAENEVIKILENSDFNSYLISEEIGELKLGFGKQESVNLKEEFSKNNEHNAKFIFLIDPLDGTSNAIKNIPSYGMSIAVAEIPHNGEATLDDVVLGFVKDYANGNYYEAIKGQGATINGKPLTPSNETEIDKITLGGFTKSKTDSVSKLVDTARRMRVLGSVVLELAYVANGEYDTFFDFRGSRIIDIAASKLIVEEAGGIVTNRYGEALNNKLSIYEKTVVVAAGNEKLHKKIIKIINNDDIGPIKKVGIVSRVDEYKSILFALKIFETLLNKDLELILESSLADALTKLKTSDNLEKIVKETMQSTPEIAYHLNELNWDIDFEKYSLDLSEFNSDLAIILGGDGTLLRSQNQMKKQIPIFGINMGTVGFLTEIEVENTFKALNTILEGNCYKENRTQIMVSHENNTFRALNEVVIMTARPAKMLHYEISVDGEVVEELRSDGLIIATPSGSTAYSMSAGGPILDPKVPGFIIIPICPYKLGVRPFVVSNESEIRIKLLKRGKKAIYVMDGQIEKEVNYMEELIFKKSEKEVEFIRLNNKYFYKKVTDKLTAAGINVINRTL